MLAIALVILIGPFLIIIAASLSAGETLVCDTSRTFLVIRNEFEVAFSEHEKFRNDSTTCRIKARFAVACPNPGKALRKITAAS